MVEDLARTQRTLTVVRQEESLGVADDLDFGIELLNRARRGLLGPTLRMYRPRPTVAFGQRDAKLPGFQAASEACRNLGFEPLIRKAGGVPRPTTGHPGDRSCGASRRRDCRGEGPILLLWRAARWCAPPRRGAGRRRGDPRGVLPGRVQRPRPGPDFPTHQIKLVGTAQRVVSGGGCSVR